MKKVKGLRWWIIGLIALATVINYIDRSTLALMWPSISKDLGMDKNDYAFILNVFMVAYAIGQLVSGKVFDKVGTKTWICNCHWSLGYFIFYAFICAWNTLLL